MFDLTLQVLEVNVVIENGHPVWQFTVAMIMPTEQGLAQIPVGRVQVPLGPEKAKETAEETLKLLEEIPKESDLAIVTNMDDARKVAEVDQAVRGGGSPDGA